MKISFDLTSTLIPNGKEFEIKKDNWKTKLYSGKIRKGAKEFDLYFGAITSKLTEL